MMAGTCSVRQCRRLVRRCLAAATVPRSELCSESIVWHEGREAAQAVPVKTEARRPYGQHSSVAGRELAEDEGILVVPLSNK